MAISGRTLHAASGHHFTVIFSRFHVLRARSQTKEHTSLGTGTSPSVALSSLELVSTGTDRVPSRERWSMLLASGSVSYLITTALVGIFPGDSDWESRHMAWNCPRRIVMRQDITLGTEWMELVRWHRSAGDKERSRYEQSITRRGCSSIGQHWLKIERAGEQAGTRARQIVAEERAASVASDAPN